jgi:CRP-like cAMP-binding protein
LSQSAIAAGLAAAAAVKEDKMTAEDNIDQKLVAGSLVTIAGSTPMADKSTSASVDSKPLPFRRKPVPVSLKNSPSLTTPSTNVALAFTPAPAKGYIFSKSLTGSGFFGQSAALLLSNAMSYFDFLDRERLGCDETQMLTTVLPSYLHDDIRAHLARDCVRAAGIFDELDVSLLREIMLSLELRVYAKNELIVDCSSAAPPAEGVFFIKSGQVRLTEKGERRATTKHPNEMFGELALLDVGDLGSITTSPWGNAISFRANTDCEVFVLTRHRLLAISKLHPNSSEQLATVREALLRRLEASKAAGIRTCTARR